jgi:hypothetical protein
MSRRRRRSMAREVNRRDGDSEVGEDVDPAGLPPVVVEGGSKAVQEDQ